MKTKVILTFSLFIILMVLAPSIVKAQVMDRTIEGMSDRFIRVAEPGELVDSVNVWGDVESQGRYLVPEGTKLPDLISFSFGYIGARGLEVDWTKTQIEIKVSRYDASRRVVDIAFFRYRYHDPEPIEMWEFDLQNNDIVTLQVRQRPSFTDYVGVVAPVVSVLATSLLLLERLTD
ncbi:MAG: hypothetical protein LAT80_14060 [Balneolaceae bacterium]|nr:hypothetical protein [Balneolaceae bacterium]